MRTFTILALLVPLLQPAARAEQTDFVRPEFVPLGKKGEVKLLGKTYSLTAEKVKGSDKSVFAKHLIRYRLLLGKLSKKEYIAFKKLLGGEPVNGFASDASYEISQFLPPFAQATEGLQFRPEEAAESPVLAAWFERMKEKEEIDPFSTTISLASNCWQTTLEYIRGGKEGFEAYYPPQEAIVKIFLDPKKFRKVKRTELATGDVLFVYEMNERNDELQARHAAVFLGGDLYFERTGAGNEFLFRIVTAKDLFAEYPSDSYLSDFLRPLTNKPAVPQDFVIDKTDPGLAKDIADPITGKLSVETAFGQGLMSYSFKGIKRYGLKAGALRWEIVE